MARAFSFARPSVGRSKPARIAMMPMTISNSIKVNPAFFALGVWLLTFLSVPFPAFLHDINSSFIPIASFQKERSFKNFVWALHPFQRLNGRFMVGAIFLFLQVRTGRVSSRQS